MLVAPVLVAGAMLLASGCLSASKAPLSFAASGADIAGQRALPGQVVSYAAFLSAEPAGVTFTVRNVRLIPLPGFRRPHLLGAVFLTKGVVPFEAFGFPPTAPATTGYAFHSLTGYNARSGVLPYRQPVVLMYGLRAGGLGAFAAAGLRVTYAVNGDAYSVDIYNGALLYYYPAHASDAESHRMLAEYSELNRKATDALKELPGVKAVLAQERPRQHAVGYRAGDGVGAAR